MKKLLCSMLLCWISLNGYSQHRPFGKYLVVIGIDGLSPHGIAQAKTPHLDSLMRVGAYSMQARAVLPSYSSPNWASMLNGVTPQEHGITSNVWKTVPLKRESHCGEKASKLWPTIFQVARRNEPNADIACFHHWKGFAQLIETEVFTMLKNTEDEDKTAQEAGAYIVANKPRFTFIHFDHVDHTGHHIGWESKAYYRAVAKADSLIGMLVASIRAAGMADETVLLITSDHGGHRRHHGGTSLAEVEIPWIITGPGIERNKQLTEPIQTYDTAATLAYILGDTAPECWLGRPVKTAFAETLAEDKRAFVLPLSSKP
ncbi:MAG: alkaline phosphatase family protein [Bacteroidota bacterium]